MNLRAKGIRTQRTAIRYALSFPDTVVLPLRQPPWFPTPQPFDLLVLRGDFWPRFVEVRTGQWGTAKPSTRALAKLPGGGYHKQVWRFRARRAVPDLREWTGEAWVTKQMPWEE